MSTQSDAVDDKIMSTIAMLAGFGILAYVAWQAFKGGVGAITNPATTALANWYVSLTGQGAMIPQGQILLPNGQSVPVANVLLSTVNAASNPSGIAGVFNYNGQTLYLNSGADSNGNYAASLSLGS